MTLTDPVSDLLARIRNAIHARHQKVDVPASKLKLELAYLGPEEFRKAMKAMYVQIGESVKK